MKRELKNIDKVIRELLPSASQEQMEADIDHLFRNLHSITPKTSEEKISVPGSRPIRKWRWSAVGAVAAAIALAVLASFVMFRSAPGSLEVAGRTIGFGQVVRAEAGEVVVLADGSRV